MDEKSKRRIELLQGGQEDLIKMFKRHLAKDVSRGQLYIWLTQNTGPLLAMLGAPTGDKPGLLLLYHTYRMIRSYISDIEDPTYPKNPNANLDWYWELIEEYLEYLTGRRSYKSSLYGRENPIGHKWRKHDKWMMSYLDQIEKCVEILTSTQEVDFSNIDISEIENTLNRKPVSLWATPEYLVNEMIELVRNYDKLINSLEDEPQLSVSEIRILERKRLKKLLDCFKGEALYSTTVTFEGLDRFSVVIFLS